jgi:hypothetical protein
MRNAANNAPTIISRIVRISILHLQKSEVPSPWTYRDLNPEPSPCHGVALPIGATGPSGDFLAVTIRRYCLAPTEIPITHWGTRPERSRAEAVGLEPTRALPQAVFKTGAIRPKLGLYLQVGIRDGFSPPTLPVIPAASHLGYRIPEASMGIEPILNCFAGNS